MTVTYRRPLSQLMLATAEFVRQDRRGCPTGKLGKVGARGSSTRARHPPATALHVPRDPFIL
jgi:hypothetical protein